MLGTRVKEIYIRARFLNNVTAKIGLSNRGKKTSSAVIGFFSSLPFSSSLTLFSLSLFFSRRIFGLILPSAFGLFSQSKDRNFCSVRSQKSSKIMLCRLLRYTSFTFLKLFVFFLLKVNGEEGRIVKLILYDAQQCRVFEQVKLQCL